MDLRKSDRVNQEDGVAAKVPSIATRRRVLATGLIIMLCLAFTSSVWRVGDGGEYMAMALRLSEFKPPAMTPTESSETERQLDGLGRGFNGLSLAFPSLTGSDGRQDQAHFWFYSMLAVPEVWLLRLFGVPPYHAFTLLNIGLLLGALWVASGSFDWPALLLIFLSPVIWWIDKAHTEVFTFSLLVVAMTLMVEQPWWALVSAAVASTQNPAIAMALPIIALTAIMVRPTVLRDWRLYLGGLVAAAFAAIAPLYYEMRLHTLTGAFLTGGALMMRPSLARLLLFLSDPNFGLIIWCPFLVVATAATAIALLVRNRQGLLPVLGSVFIAGVFMCSFAQTPNLNSGGTFGMARYAVWFIPLAIPTLARGQAVFGAIFDRWLISVAVIASVWSTAVAHPRYPEAYLYPTWLADRIWLYHPSFNNPMPEVFFERVAHSEAPINPIATSNCSKILLVGGRAPSRPSVYASRRAPRHRRSPSTTCALNGPIPSVCTLPSAFCYANRTSSGYQIVEAPR